MPLSPLSASTSLSDLGLSVSRRLYPPLRLDASLCLSSPSRLDSQYLSLSRLQLASYSLVYMSVLFDFDGSVDGFAILGSWLMDNRSIMSLNNDNDYVSENEDSE
ncbi:hypothetical protein F2Q70_00011232 [Brassica cretica]|uniref:Uncharacterized protein n=1 Tax=Brassica cretica TaxID=69181 RepID=A0A8S9M9Y3_BRACR|nr:hypothetical protein F2Q70_00011232 [Brassica cretica]KAF3548179.1 hypothetical protein DY000_02006370 [Brassica cretica]